MEVATTYAGPHWLKELDSLALASIAGHIMGRSRRLQEAERCIMMAALSVLWRDIDKTRIGVNITDWTMVSSPSNSRMEKGLPLASGIRLRNALIYGIRNPRGRLAQSHIGELNGKDARYHGNRANRRRGTLVESNDTTASGPISCPALIRISQGEHQRD